MSLILCKSGSFFRLSLTVSSAMDLSASESTAYGGLRIKEELIIKEESIEEAYLEQVTVGGAYEIEQVFLKIDPGMVSLESKLLV